MSQFTVLIYSDDSTRAPGEESPERAENDEHAGDLASSGSLVLAYALTPRAEAVSIRGGNRTDGILNNTPQIVVGYYVLEAEDLDAAVTIAAQNPVARGGDGGVEVRPVDSGGII